mgnify:CR=1 FL=1
MGLYHSGDSCNHGFSCNETIDGKVREMRKSEKELNMSLRKAWYRVWDLQDQIIQIKKAVITGDSSKLKMPEKRELGFDEQIPYGGTLEMDCIFQEEPCKQAEREKNEIAEMLESLAASVHVLTVISVMSLLIALVALFV